MKTTAKLACIAAPLTKGACAGTPPAGRQFVLTADGLGSLYIGAPLYFQHIQVGRVVGYVLLPDGKGVDVGVFVDAPYDRFVTKTTRFWHTSGIDRSVGAGSMKLKIQSLLKQAAGGIACGWSDANDDAAPTESRFALHSNHVTALQGTPQRIGVLIAHSDQDIALTQRDGRQTLDRAELLE